jgi:hypothetical protein
MLLFSVPHGSSFGHQCIANDKFSSWHVCKSLRVKWLVLPSDYLEFMKSRIWAALHTCMFSFVLKNRFSPAQPAALSNQVVIT